jgi:hypothetical protein
VLGKVLEADRDGVFGPQAQLGAGDVLGHEHAPADVLAGQVDEHLGRLQNGRLDATEALARKQPDQGLECLSSGHWRCLPRHPGLLLATAGRDGDGFRPRE